MGICRTVTLAVAIVALVATPVLRADGVPTTAPMAAMQTSVQPLLDKYCYECHADGVDRGDLAMDGYKSLTDMRKDMKVWQKVLQYARTSIMPPPKAKLQPTQEERDQLVESLHRELYQIDPANPDPGRITVRRLNRSEYRNTIRDLIGPINFDPTIDFPQDDTGYGFDNIGDVLTLPPMLMEKYLATTERILGAAIATDSLEQHERHVPATRAQRSTKAPADLQGDWVSLSSRNEDSLTVPIKSASRADYIVRVLAYARPNAPATQPTTAPADSRPIRLSILAADDLIAGEFDVTTDAEHPQWYEAHIGVGTGKQAVRAAVRRYRSPTTLPISAGRVGEEQPGEVFVKEIVVDGPVQGAVRRVDNERLKISGYAELQKDVVSMPRSDDMATATVDIPAEGEHLVRVQACADQVGDEPARMELLVDGAVVGAFDVMAWSGIKPSPHLKGLVPGADRAVFRAYEARTMLSAGKHKIAARFLNDLWLPDNDEPNLRDRNLYVQDFEIVNLAAAPLPPPMTPPMRELFVKYAGREAGLSNAKVPHDADVARKLLGEFTRRAWRRPVDEKELDRVMRLYALSRDNGDSFHEAVKFAMKGVLVSSSFLFRGEPTSAQVVDATKTAQPIAEFDLASRLSYFLWSSMPDDELLDLADRGELRRNLDAQVKRMLASSKADALVDNFAGQWLQFRNLDAVHPDRKLFKTYNDKLRDDMQRETQMFFTNILRQDRSLMDVLTADYTFVNERLAKHYGLKEEVKGEQFRRVSLDGTPRRGVITQGSVLTITSNPTRTSPVKRGKWVLENLLASPPPPPPANVPPLDSEERQLKGTLRQRLEQHRASKACASCHAPLDPIGFGLENFDAIGAWRDKDGDAPVDASSAFVNGPKFTGAFELIDLLAKTRRKDFYRSVSEAALTFALGRGIEPYDQPAVERIVRDLQANDGRFSTLIFGVVDSVPFQMRRADVSPPVDAARASADGITR